MLIGLWRVTDTAELFHPERRQAVSNIRIWYQAEETPELVTLTVSPSPKCTEIHNRMQAFIDVSDMDALFYDSVEDAERLLAPANDADIWVDAI